MRNLLLLLALLVFFLLLSCKTDQLPPGKYLVIANVTVIDGTDAPAKPGYNVLIANNRIISIEKADTSQLPAGAQVIDGKGKFLIPGLWDMHAHPFLDQERFPHRLALNLYLANGITGLRDMFSPLDDVNRYRAELSAGKIVGPRIITCGPLIDGPKPAWANSIAVSDEKQAREAVVSLKGRGADFVKVYDLLPREAYFAIADEAKRIGIPFVGHVPLAISLKEASDAGQKSIEHFTGILQACSTDEEKLHEEALKEASGPDNSAAIRALLQIDVKALNSYNSEKAAALFTSFVKNGTWLDPTMVAYTVDSGNYDRNDYRLKYIPRALREEWDPKNSIVFKAFSEQDFQNSKLVFNRYIEIVRIMHQAGVEFLAGTDSPVVPYCFPGFGLHDEMALFVKAGLTPLQALQTATRNPAKFFNLLDSLGTVEAGKIANLVILEADPLQDIGNTRKISTVIIEGKVIDQESIGKLLTEVQTAFSAQ
ncbi:MAG: amidohydrolase family protein [Acidobacteriota bacterium]